MRAKWDYSTLELVRTKVQGLKKSLRNVEWKLREARESLVVVPELQCLHYEVSSDGFMPKPLWIESQGASNDKRFCTKDENNNNEFEGLNGFTEDHKRVDNPISNEYNSGSELTWLDGKGDVYRISALQQLTSKLETARTNLAAIKQRTAELHGRVDAVNNKVLRVILRMHASEDALKTLQAHLEGFFARVENLKLRAKQRKECKRNISKLQKMIELATNRANEAENREGELETQVVELEDNIEVYDMKLHRAKKVLHRMSQASESSETENCSVTMVLRRASLSRQSSTASLKGTLSRQSSTTSFKGHAPLIMDSSIDSCGEESDIFD